MIEWIILQTFGALLATIGIVFTASVLWVVLWLANRYEKSLAEGE